MPEAKAKPPVECIANLLCVPFYRLSNRRRRIRRRRRAEKGSLLGGTLVVKFQSFQPVLDGKASESDQCVGIFVYHSD